jgi:hypothetical protein
MQPLDELPYIEYVTKAGDTKRIYADAWMSEDMDATATATQHAVSSGAKVSDHYQPDPQDIKVTLFFSEEPIRADLDPTIKGKTQVIPIAYPPYPNNTPLLSPGGLTNAAGSAIGAGARALGIDIGGASLPSSYSALRFDVPPGRLRTVYQTLMQLRHDKMLVSIGTTVARLDDCALVGIHLGRKPEDGTGGAIDLTLQQLAFVTTEEAKAVPLPLEPRGAAKPTDAKAKTGEVDPGAQTGILKGLLNKAGVTPTGSGV